MQKWEYMFISTQLKNKIRLVYPDGRVEHCKGDKVGAYAVINELGAKGWEAIFVEGYDSSFSTWTMKRLVNEG